MHSYSPQSLLNVAEEKFKGNDVEEAFRLANMAKKLDPLFEAIDNLVVVYGVHVAASRKKPNGGVDWYAVLGLHGSVPDVEAAKKNYKKLALMVHPDKNRSAAAEGAFKLISQAWNAISSQGSRVKPDDNVRKSTSPSSGARKAPKPSSGATPASSSRPAAPSSSSTFGRRECLKCKRWFLYHQKERFSLYCFFCDRKSSCPVPPGKSSRAEGQSTATDRVDPAGSSNKRPPVKCGKCLWCNSPYVYRRSTDTESVRCTRCKFGQTAQAKEGWKPLWGVEFHV